MELDNNKKIGWSKPNENTGGGTDGEYDDTAIKEEIRNIKNDINEVKDDINDTTITDTEVDDILTDVFGSEYIE